MNSRTSPPTAFNRVRKSCLDDGARNNTPCWICGRAISYRTSATVHYVIALADGGDPLDPNNLTPVHKQCVPPINSRRW
jgi:5-methylcytosine-specific restriction endonuclease McrA